MSKSQLLFEQAEFYRERQEIYDDEKKFLFLINTLHLSKNSLSKDHILSISHKIETAKTEEEKEVLGLEKAYQYMLELARGENPSSNLNENTIKEMHCLLLENSEGEARGCYRTQHKKTGNYTHPLPEDLEHLMRHLGDQISSSKYTLHPIELIAMTYKRVVDISPFERGNEAIASLLMNLVSIENGYGILSISKHRREEYEKALENSRFHFDMDSFPILIAECILDQNKKDTLDIRLN